MEYPMEPFELGLEDVQFWCFELIHDWMYIDFQTSHFANFEQFKIDNNLADFGQVIVDPTH